MNDSEGKSNNNVSCPEKKGCQLENLTTFYSVVDCDEVLRSLALYFSGNKVMYGVINGQYGPAQVQNDTNISNASPGDDIWDDMFGVKWHNYMVSRLL